MYVCIQRKMYNGLLITQINDIHISVSKNDCLVLIGAVYCEKENC